VRTLISSLLVMWSMTAMADELGYVGTWNITLSLDQSTCRDTPALETAQQWLVSEESRGEYSIAVLGSTGIASYTGSLQGRVLNIKGVAVHEIPQTRAGLLLIAAALLSKNAQGELTGHFLATQATAAVERDGFQIQPVCANVIDIRGVR
jgi:hypothetical protein